MNINERIKRENIRKERRYYNLFYDKNMLSKLNLLIENDDIWLSSLQLAEISGRMHKHVLRDISRDIYALYMNLSYNIPEVYEDVLNKGWTKTFPGPNVNLMEYINDVRQIFDKHNVDIFDREIVESIKYKIKQRRTVGGTYEYYLLNREAALMCMMRYSPVVRAHVSNLFLKSADMLKSKGYEIKSVEDMYMSVDEEINNSIDTLESGLDEDGLLSEFNMWHLLWLLLRKIPKSIAKYFAKEFPSFYTLYDMAERFGDFTSPNFIDPDKKGKGGF